MEVGFYRLYAPFIWETSEPTETPPTERRHFPLWSAETRASNLCGCTSRVNSLNSHLRGGETPPGGGSDCFRSKPIDPPIAKGPPEKQPSPPSGDEAFRFVCFISILTRRALAEWVFVLRAAKGFAAGIGNSKSVFY